mmetsp:Transcript_3579/g.5586  ORF Transcript_3579/g.5586 Transcript_3579/m.5586 type:complete len:523 (-) Transcript_3579:96-1664(-)|eukprot:CAMPEP_0174990604 /NCGR_PEP_ID=MMETSP0004_2-20121128/21419_1 /TAXON_ID=420556 /ORGANISM="Ochromonas sp., Strain CCMP1393" /LENGTH=522 /DNA_ID=CAMNT_0016244241 /DNA_START=102 /DNA_END=1670 /DNA_ORIENTATION=-
MDPFDPFADVMDGPVDDSITSLEYNENGEYLATGDRMGRITVLKLEDENKETKIRENWIPYFQYQSHDPEFDFLKSLEIEAKINRIKFCHSVGENKLLISANDKTVKLWKIGSKREFIPQAVDSYEATGKLRLPSYKRSSVNKKRSSFRSNGSEVDGDTDRDLSSSGSSNFENDASTVALHATEKRVFANGHAYHINSLDTHSDGCTFISADDLRVNWWNLEISDTAFTVVDIKPENMEELTEVITSVQFHPFDANIMSFSSSRGAIKVMDMRCRALCSSYCQVYQDTLAERTATTKSFITDILNSISDAKYTTDGRYLVSRDYMTIKIWDVNMEDKPVETIPLHDHIRPMLYDLYSSDIIFDKFEVCCSPDGKRIASGSYSNQLKVYNWEKGVLKDVELPSERIDIASGSIYPQPLNMGEASGVVDVKISVGGKTSSSSNDSNNSSSNGSRSGSPSSSSASNGRRTTTSRSRTASRENLRASSDSSDTEVKLDEKVLHCTWHPTNNTIAVAGVGGLCLYKV